MVIVMVLTVNMVIIVTVAMTGDDLELHDDLASVDKPVDAEAELKKEEAEHAAAMQRIAQQVGAGASLWWTLSLSGLGPDAHREDQHRDFRGE